MAQTAGGGKSFRTWRDGLAESIPSWDRVSFASCLEGFCSVCETVNEPFHVDVAALKLEGAGDFLNLLLSILSKAMPELWNNAKQEFEGKLIGSSELFTSYQGRFLPSPQRASQSVWQSLAELPTPSQEFHVLTKMSPILKISSDTMKPLQQAFEYNSVRIVGIEFINLHLSSDDPDLVLLCAAADRATQKLKESGRHQEKEILDFFSDYMLAPVFSIMEKTLCVMLDEAVKAIPNQVDKLIESRNIVSIKNTLFHRATHIKASGLLQDLPGIWRLPKTTIALADVCLSSLEIRVLFSVQAVSSQGLGLSICGLILILTLTLILRW